MHGMAMQTWLTSPMPQVSYSFPCSLIPNRARDGTTDRLGMYSVHLHFYLQTHVAMELKTTGMYGVVL